MLFACVKQMIIKKKNTKDSKARESDLECTGDQSNIEHFSRESELYVDLFEFKMWKLLIGL